MGEFSKTFLMLKPEKSGKEETKGKAALNSGAHLNTFILLNICRSVIFYACDTYALVNVCCVVSTKIVKP